MSEAPATQVPLGLRIERALRRQLYLVCRTLVRGVGLDFVGPLGTGLGELHYRLGGRARRRIEREVALLLGRRPGEPAVRELVRSAYRVNDAAVLEILKLFDRAQDLERLRAKVEIRGIERLRDALAAGRGAILLAGHMGNGALLVIDLVARGIPVSVVYHQARMMDPGLFSDGMARYGIDGIVANEGLRAYGRMLSALRANRVVYLMADQGVGKAREGIALRFLGKDMWMPAGPAQLARHSKAPVLPVATTAVEPRWGFEILPAVERDENATLEADVERLLRVSEGLILEHPQFWSWHHRRWREYPLAADAVPPPR